MVIALASGMFWLDVCTAHIACHMIRGMGEEAFFATVGRRPYGGIAEHANTHFSTPHARRWNRRKLKSKRSGHSDHIGFPLVLPVIVVAGVVRSRAGAAAALTLPPVDLFPPKLICCVSVAWHTVLLARPRRMRGNERMKAQRAGQPTRTY